MAKLNKELQKQTNDASDSFEAVPDGAYHVRLRNVDTDREGPSGPYWTWEFEIVGPDNIGRRLWNNTSLSPQSAWVLKQTFTAFGVEADADTDDLCGQVVKALVETRVIQAGARKGETGNQITRLMPADEDFTVPAGSGGSADPDDIFGN